jgi:DNA mismatch repair protein MSH6
MLLCAGISDLERAVARLHASTVSGAEGRDAHNVVLYEDAKKRRVRALTSAIRDLKVGGGGLGALVKGTGLQHLGIYMYRDLLPR